MADPTTVITLNLCQLKSISQTPSTTPVDNPSEYEHHHMSNKIVFTVDQRMKVTVSVHPSLRNLTRVVLDLHDSHHH
jgi:hypothetical protein